MFLLYYITTNNTKMFQKNSFFGLDILIYIIITIALGIIHGPGPRSRQGKPVFILDIYINSLIVEMLF